MSSFIVAQDGKLYHHGLLGLELNSVYQNSFIQDLNFGYDEE